MAAVVHRHIQRRGSWSGLQRNERVRITRGERKPQCGPFHRGQSANTQRQNPEVYPRTVRPTERSPQAQNADAQSRGTRNNAVRLGHVELARVPLRYAAPSPPQVLDSRHRLAKAQSRRPPDFLSSHLLRREMRASRRLYAGGGSCLRDLWRAWRIRDCRSA